MINQTALQHDIRSITDESYANHKGWPANFSDALLRWVTVIDRATGPLLPASTTHLAAYTAALLTPPGPGIEVLILAWGTYCRILATGMVGFSAFSPLTVLSFSTVSALGLSGASAEQCATEMARVTKKWLQSGTAVPRSGGALINWN